MKHFKLVYLIFCMSLVLQKSSANEQKADLIVFSFDRPMQLHALLESIQKYVKNLNEICVLYRSSSDRFDSSYQTCFDSFKDLNIRQIKQTNENAGQVFKPLLLHCIKSTEKKHILFAVDDIIVKDTIDLSECIKHLDKTKAIGFYLRLGKNISECYTEQIKAEVPNYEKLNDDVYIYSFKGNKGDWNYPYTVDMTLYNKEEIINQIQNLNFYNPNRFEGNWHINEWFYNQDSTKKGIFFEYSKIVNIPLNIVQTEAISRNMGLSCYTLLEKYEKGLKIDISPFYKLNNKSPHIEFDVTFIPRFPFDELWNALEEQDMGKIKNLETSNLSLLKSLKTNIFDIKNENGYSPLMWACNGQHIDAVKFLLDNNADVNAGDKNDFTSLMYACWRGNFEIVKLLIEHKANPDAIDINGTTALTMADRSDSIDKEKIISLLIDTDL